MRIWAAFLVLFMVFALPGVEADNEPNDSIDEAELVGMGTYSGSVQNTADPHDIDYYKLEIPEHKMLRVNVTAGTGSSIEVWILDENGEVVMHETVANGSETTLWYDEPGAVAYIKVVGNGEYTFKVLFEDSLSEKIEDVVDSFTKGFTRILLMCVAAIVFVVIVIGVVIILINRSKRQNIPPPGAGLPPEYPGPQNP